MINIFEKITTFLMEAKTETKKVNWPTREQTLRYTLMVIAVMVVAATFLGGVDFAFTFLIKKIITLRSL